MVLRSAALVLLIVSAFARASVAQEPAPKALEGYVFGKFTGVPLWGAILVIRYTEGGTETRTRAITDANGFYSFDATGVDVIDVDIFCETRRLPIGRTFAPAPGPVVGEISVPTEWTGTLQRNAYLETPALASFSQCGTPGIRPVGPTTR